jgi:hypothetical protein
LKSWGKKNKVVVLLAKRLLFTSASLDKKRYTLGSTFPEKLIYENGTYQTEADENVLVLIANTGKDLGGKKEGRRDLFRLPSCKVDSPDEFSNQLMEFFKQVYKLKDVIN